MKKYLFFILFVCISAFAVPLKWQMLAPGLEYSNIKLLGLTDKGIHIFRIDLKRYHLQSALTQKYNRLQTIESLVKNENAMIGVNGGFFSPDLKPLGLRINQGQIKNPIKNTSWWGVFYTQGSHAYIASPKNFHANKNINFAVQSGPRLIINGQIPSFKPGVANRTALGITRDNKLILLATSRFPLSTQELAQLMAMPTKQGGLDCVNALNLDGGSSTQLYANINNFILSIPSFAVVSDAVLVMPRQ